MQDSFPFSPVSYELSEMWISELPWKKKEQINQN